MNAEINHVIALIELESFVLRISSNCKIFDVADIGSVPGYNKLLISLHKISLIGP